MKQTTITILLTALVIAGCSESSTTKNSSSSSNNSTACLYDYYTNPQCPGYGQSTGGTTSGSTSGGNGGYNNTLSNNNWQGLYYSGSGINNPEKPPVPPLNCTPASGPGLPGPRKASITMAFGTQYSPDLPGLSAFSSNISSFLTNVNSAKLYYDTDVNLKFRFIAKPQPQGTTSSGTLCYGRNTGSSVYYGYTKLSFSVSLKKVAANGTLEPDYIGTQNVEASLNTCSQPVDFTGYAADAPHGVVMVIHNVRSNQGCSYYPCNAFSASTRQCWHMDVETAVDGTQTF